MFMNNQGKLEDKVNQDPNNACFKFARTFSLLYDDICNAFPIF